MPFITEEIYESVFKREFGGSSIHVSKWPEANHALVSDEYETAGVLLMEVATAIRRYKSEKKIPMGSKLEKIKINAASAGYANILKHCLTDIKSVTRATQIEIEIAKLDMLVSVTEIA